MGWEWHFKQDRRGELQQIAYVRNGIKISKNCLNPKLKYAVKIELRGGGIRMGRDKDDFFFKQNEKCIHVDP